MQARLHSSNHLLISRQSENCCHAGVSCAELACRCHQLIRLGQCHCGWIPPGWREGGLMLPSGADCWDRLSPEDPYCFGALSLERRG